MTETPPPSPPLASESDLPPQQAIDPARRRLYLRGRTGVFSLRADPRFSYCLYVPEPRPGPAPPGLLVAVHHSLRNFMECRDRFATFAEEAGLMVLAPLFPIGVHGDGDPDGYKYLDDGRLRYDRLLDAMVDEVAEATRCQRERFMLYGYSGGGHFAHRYFLLHPQRLRAVVIGAPGQVTLIDDRLPWWQGTADLARHFGHGVDPAALRRVPVQLLVGALDTQLEELVHLPGTRYWRPGTERPEHDRIERLRALQASLETAGVAVDFELMPDVTHGGGTAPAIERACRFFANHLAGNPG